MQAIFGTIRQLGLLSLIRSRRCRQRDPVVAMMAERLHHPGSNPATTRSRLNITLAAELAVAGVSEEQQ